MARTQEQINRHMRKMRKVRSLKAKMRRSAVAVVKKRRVTAIPLDGIPERDYVERVTRSLPEPKEILAIEVVKLLQLILR